MPGMEEAKRGGGLPFALFTMATGWRGSFLRSRKKVYDYMTINTTLGNCSQYQT